MASYRIHSILVMLIIAAYLVLHTEPDSVEITDKMTAINPQSINLIRINKGSVSTVLTKHNANWYFQQPFTAKAVVSRIDLLLSLLNSTRYTQLKTEYTTKLSDFGFNDSSITLYLNHYQFQFGGSEPLTQSRYILFEKKLYLIDDNISPLLNNAVNGLIEPHLFLPSDSIKKITLPYLNTNKTFNGKLLTIEKKQGHWHSHSQILTPKKLAALIKNWQAASALYVSKTNVAHQTVSSRPTVTVWLEQQSEPIIFELALSAAGLAVQQLKQPLSYHFPTQRIPTLLPLDIEP